MSWAHSRVPISKSVPFLAALALCAFALLTPALADTGTSRKPSAGGCYCGCSSRPARMGDCTKMCDLPRYSSRWWATTCAKPRMHSAPQDHDAGPRFPRPGRAERASL